MAFDHVFELLPGEVVVEIMAMPRPVPEAWYDSIV